MKAVQIIDGKPTFVNLLEPSGDGVKVKVVSASICGTDMHLIPMGIVEGRVLGHEFAGYTPDGTAVAIEPAFSCGDCDPCEHGLHFHCETAATIIAGVGVDGGMQEYTVVPENALVTLPSGIDVATANLVEPLAVSVRGLERGRVTNKDRVLVIGGGAVGISTVACLRARGVSCTLSARYPHQQASGERLGASLDLNGGYDVVIDCVGSESSVSDAVAKVKPLGRIVMLGNFWEPTPVGMELLLKEVEFIGSVGYRCRVPNRTFAEAARILHGNPAIADAIVTHRFPLEGASEAFATAADRKNGAIKVAFDIAS